MSNEAPPRTGGNPEQLADYGFYTGIGGIILTLLNCIPLIGSCFCLLALPLGIGATVLALMARSQLGAEATGQAHDRANYGLYLGIATIVLTIGVRIVFLSLGAGLGALDNFINQPSL